MFGGRFMLGCVRAKKIIDFRRFKHRNKEV